MTQYHDRQYLNLIDDVLKNGIPKTDRTGTGTRSVFSRQMRFDLNDGTIPLLTTKKMHLKSMVIEILWYLTGDTNIKFLNDNKVSIWDEWADENGNLGPVYGSQWRRWKSFKQFETQEDLDAAGYRFFTTCCNGQKLIGFKRIDQIAEVINTLRTSPNSRRMLVNAWNVGDLNDMALPPCHYAFQFWVGDGRLSCMLNQRSCDVGLGVPFNIGQYSILLRMIAHVTGYQPGEFIWNGGDVHIYNNHIETLTKQSARDPHPSPTLTFAREVSSIDDFTLTDFVIEGYDPHPKLSMEVSV